MRRVHLPDLDTGLVTPDPAQSRHLVTVLRLNVGDVVEAFDDAGRTAAAVVTSVSPTLMVQIDAVASPQAGPEIVVAAAVPKGDRAEWLVEKLSELGVARYIPLRTARSVVHPEGKGKTERWQRVAIESAKQCRRPGVLTIEPLTDLAALLVTLEPTTSFFCSTNPAATPLVTSFVSSFGPRRSATLLIGPEGDWSPDEESTFVARGLTPVGLGRTILRVETAAMLAAGLAMQLAWLDAKPVSDPANSEA